MIASRVLRERPALLLSLLPVALALFDLRFHEFWRDETSPALVGSSIPWDLFPLQMRIEGIPFLFHALLKILASVLPPWAALLLAGVIGFSALLFGTYRLLLSISFSPRRSALVTLLFACTYTYAYELGVVIRQYALGLGLALAALAYLRDGLRLRSRRAVVLGTIAGGLATILSAHSACVAGGAFAAFVLLALTRRGGVRLAWPTIFALPSFAVTFLIAQPFVGRAPEYNAFIPRSLGAVGKLSLQALAKGLAPSDWWFADFLATSPAGVDRVAACRYLAVLAAFAATLAVVAARAPAIARRWKTEGFDVLAILIGWVPQLEIACRHSWGYNRHHLFFVIPGMVILAGWAIDVTVTSRLLDALRRSWLLLAAPWFAFQIGLAIADLALDVQKPFADTRAFAAKLPEGARVVSEADWPVVGLLIWRPDLQISAATGGGRHFRYVIADNAWHWPVPLAPLVSDACAEAPDRVFFAGASTRSVKTLDACLSPVPNPTPASAAAPQTWENFSMWRVDCDCARSKQGVKN